MNILIINGPNLNLLGKREPDIYGNCSFEEYLTELQSMFVDAHFTYLQSNHEGQIIDWLQEYGFGKADGIVLNAGGYTHTSVSIRDAVSAIQSPVVEVHISNILQREEFRHFSYLTDVCTHTIMGKGISGYQEAVEWLKNNLKR